jgi:quercetin dioxygenase-like cupin family protein
MIENAEKKSPKLSFLPPEEFPGMNVFEIDLTKSGEPIAPFKASRFTVEPNCSSPIDSHEVHEIWMVAEGEGELLYDAQSIRVRVADVFYFEPHKSHQIINDGNLPISICSIWWKG